MSEMIERVARALAFLNCSDQAEADRCWVNYCGDAAAAIEAMREPIIAAVLKAKETNEKKYFGRYFEDCIPEMIGDAIEEALK